MADRIVVDPVTRIEGHLRAEVEISNGTIKDAFVSATMVRGLENIVRGRNPKDVWAFVQRTCGVCTASHALASVRSVEDALGIVIPPNAELVRNLMLGSLYLHDHVVHFYHLHAFDWVDVVNGLSADPVKTSQLAQSISDWPNSSPGYFSDLQKRLKNFVASGQLGIFANGYWGHPAMKLPPEANLMATAHYLEALEWQKEIVKIHAIFGGKNPHPNFLVGGMACAVNPNDPSALNAERLAYVLQLLQQGKEFVEKVYLPDLMAVASFYKDWGAIGGFNNFMTFGDLPTMGYHNTDRVGTFKFPSGVILNKDLTHVQDIDLRNASTVAEHVNNSWYDYTGDANAGKQPWDGETNIHYTGPKPPYEHLDVSQKYSFIKTPRWKGQPMEVGPLARVLVGYALGKPEYKDAVDRALKQLQVPATALFSTLGRTLARCLETQIVANWNLEFYDQLIDNIKKGDTKMANMEKWDTSTWPADAAKGVGLLEAPRGALSHWIVIKDGKVANYQQIVPSTWNASPRDPKGQRSPYESTLIGTPVANPQLPLEIIRTIHSFDPCIACAVHVYDENGDIVKEVSDISVCEI